MAFANSVDYRIPTLRPQLWGRAVDNYVDLNLPDDRWMLSKLESVPMGCPTLRAFPEDPCIQVTWGVPEAIQTPTTTFSPFRIEESITCSTLGAWSPDELQEWATKEAQAIYSAALARQVWGGLYTAGASTLASEADDVTSPTGTTPMDALSAVEYGLGQRLFGQGMVHVTVDVLTRLRSAGVLTLLDGRYYTPSGNIVVADYGYYNTGSAFIYGSGMVGYDTHGWEVTTGWVRNHNDYVVYVNTWAVVEFEPCAVVKAATSVTTPANFGGV